MKRAHGYTLVIIVAIIVVGYLYYRKNGTLIPSSLPTPQI